MIDDCVRKQRCRKTRQEILKKHFPMRFTRWYDEAHIRHTNCYGYVFNMWIVSEDDDRFSYLGWTERDAKPYYIKEKGLKSSGVYIRYGRNKTQASPEEIKSMLEDMER